MSKETVEVAKRMLTVEEQERTVYQVLGRAEESIMRRLEGRLCTLVEAVIEDEGRAKATKDIVRTTIWEEYRQLSTLMQGILFDFSQDPQAKLLPDWLEERFKKERQ